MATHSQTRSDMSLEEFLRWPRIDERPYLEYFDGRIEVKVSPQIKHGVIQLNFANAINGFARPAGLGLAFPELRCTFAGKSFIPDVVFLRDARILSDEAGDLVDESPGPPDIHVEIRSPKQTLKKTREKLEHSMARGCPLGWYVDPERKTVDVYRPGQAPERLPSDGFLDGAPALPGFRIAVAEVFGWLKYRVRAPEGPGAGLE